MKRFLALVPAFVIATGCGTYSGLPADLVLGEMSEEQAVQLCEADQRYTEENLSEAERKEFGCGVSALIAGAMGAATGGDFTEICEEAKDECMEAEPEDDEGEDAGNGCEDMTYPENCEATVEQHEACMRERVEDMKKAVDEFTCTEPTGDEDEDEDEDEESACEIYLKACGLEG